LGLISDTRWQAFERKQEAIEREQQRLHDTWIRPAEADPTAVAEVLDGSLSREFRASELLRRPKVNYQSLMALAGPGVEDPYVAEQVETQIKYAGYIERQLDDIARNRRNEQLVLPSDLDYSLVHGLSAEVQEKLNRLRPTTLGQAGRTAGITPAAISLLLVHLKRGRSKLALRHST
jgi:tRNA uridine 5-carboxymethylaminomethyl modification enzyme